MDWGETEAKIVAAATNGGMIPDLPFLSIKPDIEIHLRFEWNAFWTLSTDRQIGMSPGPIPWTSIDRYASRYKVDGDDFDRLSRVIRLMDAAYRDYHKPGKT